MYFLSDLSEAQFGSREINVKAYTRIINGKAVPVRGARRTVLAIKDALNDLRNITKDKHEAAYLMNPRTGKVGREVMGEKFRVEGYSNVENTRKGNMLSSNIVKDKMVLHNHPNRSTFSLEDMFLEYKGQLVKSNNVFVINNTGSTFRAKNLSAGRAKADVIYDHGRMIEDSLLNILKKNSKTLGAVSSNKDNTEFFVSHVRNLLLKDAGAISYRYKLSDVDKKFVTKYAPVIDYLRESYANRTLHTIERLPKLVKPLR